MDGSCQDEASCSYRDASKITDFVKNRIESCIQKYMSFEETAKNLLDEDNISHDITKIIWEQLQKESPEFFNNYNLRCKTVIQAKIFKDLQDKYVGRLIEHKQASDNAKLSPPNLAFSSANGPSVMSKIPNDQQNQFQRFSGSFAVPVVKGSSVTQNDQQAQIDALAYTLPEDLSTFGFGSEIGHNGPSFQGIDMELAAQPLMQSNGQIQELARLNPPHLQLQQNFSVEAPQTPQCGGGSNGYQNGETIHQPLRHNFDTSQSWRLHTSVDEQQARGVNRHHPESEALNNPNIGDGTLTTAQNHHGLQKKRQRRSPKDLQKKVQRRSLEDKKPYQSEETKRNCKQ